MKDAFTAFMESRATAMVAAMRRHVVLFMWGEFIGNEPIDWFRARRRHPELRLAGPKGKLP